MKKVIINESQAETLRKLRAILVGRNYFPELCNGTKTLNEAVSCSYGNLLPLMMNEGLIMSYPPEKTANYIKREFNIPDDMVRVEKATITVAVDNPRGNIDMVNRLMRAMQLCGYYLSFPRWEGVKTNSKRTSLQFSRKYDRAVKDEVLNGEKELLHVTPTRNVRKIQQIGLVPGAKNRIFTYPERIYLLKGSTPMADIVDLGEMLASVSNHGKDGEERDYDYSVVHLDISKIPQGVKFFPDHDYEGYGLYTIDNIPPTAITKIERLPLNLY